MSIRLSLLAKTLPMLWISDIMHENLIHIQYLKLTIRYFIPTDKRSPCPSDDGQGDRILYTIHATQAQLTPSSSGLRHGGASVRRWLTFLRRDGFTAALSALRPAETVSDMAIVSTLHTEGGVTVCCVAKAFLTTRYSVSNPNTIMRTKRPLRSPAVNRAIIH